MQLGDLQTPDLHICSGFVTQNIETNKSTINGILDKVSAQLSDPGFLLVDIQQGN